MTPRPVKTVLKPRAKGTATPATPGCSQGSPSSAIPWTAIATRPASAVCSCTASSFFAKPGRRITLPDIISPRKTETVTRTSATRPEARLASHQPWDWIASAVRGVHRFTCGSRIRGATASEPTSSTRPLSWIRKPPRSARIVAPALGPGEQRRLGEGLRLQRAVAEGGGADQAGPGRLAAGGVEQVVGEAAVGVAPDPHVDPRGGDPAGAEPQHVGAAAGDRVFDEDLVGVHQRVGAADADVAAAVDDEARVAAQGRRDHVGGETLAGAAGVEAQARRPDHLPRLVVDGEVAPAAARGGAAPGAAAGASASASLSGRPAIPAREAT